MKYIVVTGGVISGIGKGITSSSIGILFQSLGYVVTMIKIDPYLNVDAGTMSPYEHGECFVLSDGGECDLDLGNYERFLNIQLTREHNITTGRIYQAVIEKERRGDYLGATVQIVPHITDEIISHITRVSKLPVGNEIPDICVIEIGGTIGDIEGLPFIEALQQMRAITNDDFCFVHVAMAINNPELKTKPIQHSVSTLRSRGIFPNLLVIRSKEELPSEIKHKLHRLCQISSENIISNPDVPTIYHVAHIFHKQNICECISPFIGELNNLPPKTQICSDPRSIYFGQEIERIPDKDIIYYFDNLSTLPVVNVGIVGKYIGNNLSPDTYISLIRAIEHASFYLNINTINTFISSDDDLSKYDAFIIPGGFGSRGIPGKLQVAKYARDNNIPILGICLGMQVMVVDSLRRIRINATSREWTDLVCDPNEPISYVVDLLPGQTEIKGGTMRLGNYTTTLTSPKLQNIYHSEIITERHRHRYEVSDSWIDDIYRSGLIVSGINHDATLVEIVELPDHPFYIGCQFHPEFRSYINEPHPLFVELLRSCNY